MHLTTFPKPESKRQNPDLEKRWEQLLAVRAHVQAALEIQRREKLIGAPLEAKVVVEANAEKYKFLKHYERELPGLFIVSQVELKEVHDLLQTPDFKVSVTKAEGIKCERCWNYRTTVGEDSVHPTLCDRCCGAITENA